MPDYGANSFMGTDRVEIHDASCPCGKGRILITRCSPDHPYAMDSQSWIESGIDCETCRKDYALVEVEEGFRLATAVSYQADMAAKKASDAAYAAVKDRFWKDSESAGDLTAIATHLNEFRSRAAAMRFLSEAGIPVTPSLSRRFLKGQCNSQWIKENISWPEPIGRILNLIGRPTTFVQRFYGEVKSTSRTDGSLLVFVGSAIVVHCKAHR